MLQFPLGGRFRIVTDAVRVDLADAWTPWQSRENNAAAGKRVEVHVMIPRPGVCARIRKEGFSKGDIGMLECEFANTVT